MVYPVIDISHSPAFSIIFLLQFTLCILVHTLETSVRQILSNQISSLVTVNRTFILYYSIAPFTRISDRSSISYSGVLASR